MVVQVFDDKDLRCVAIIRIQKSVKHSMKATCQHIGIKAPDPV